MIELIVKSRISFLLQVMNASFWSTLNGFYTKSAILYIPDLYSRFFSILILIALNLVLDFPEKFWYVNHTLENESERVNKFAIRVDVRVSQLSQTKRIYLNTENSDVTLQ